jgi:phosphatidylglycerophosphate synthase
VQPKLPNTLPNKSHNNTANQKPEYLPSLLSLLRIAILPFFAYSFLNGHTWITYALFLLTIGTDFTDGYIARKLRITSNFGAHLDITVDFVFVLSTFAIFFIAGCYPYWLMLLILFMYLQFIATSHIWKITYDPVGKYYGSLLYGAIGFTLLLPKQPIYDTLTIGIVAITLTLLFSRIAYYMRSHNRKKIAA